MSEEKVLTKEIAEQFLMYEDSINLREFTEIEDDAANELSKYKGRGLSLDGLTKLSDAVAESLGKVNAGLDLRGLTELSDAAAESLSNHKGQLFLTGISELSEKAAESLSNHSGMLVLSDLLEFSESVIRHIPDTSDIYFTSHGSPRVITKGLAMNVLNLQYADFSKYTQIDDDAAEVFGGPECDNTRLILGLTELSDAAAQSLAKHEGDLHLDNLKEVSDSVAESLVKCKQSLWLGGLTELSDSAAKSFGSCDKSIYLRGLGLNLTDSAASFLAGNPKVEIKEYNLTKSALRAFYSARDTKDTTKGCLSSVLVFIGLLWSVYELTP